MPARWWIGPAAAVLGGAAWTAHAVLLSRRPQGCVDEECSVPGTAHRPSEDLAWLFVLAVVALAVAVVAAGPARSGTGRRLVRAGAVLLWVGAGLLVGGVALNASLSGDSPLWWLHDTDALGRLVPVAGTSVTGLGLLRRGRPCRWPGTVLVVGSLVSLPFNVQDDRVLLDVPVGLAWVAVGAWWGYSRHVTRRTPVG